MRTAITLLTLATGLLASLATAHVQLHATLTPDQEVPPTASAASGTGAFTLNPDGTVEFILTASHLCGPIVGVHIHQAPPGKGGGIILPLSNSLSGTTTQQLTPDQQAALISGGTYVNIHTGSNGTDDCFPLGEIRGQITLVPGTCPCDGSTPKAFRRCVAKEIKKLSKDDRKDAAVAALKKAVKKAACGKTKGGGKKAVGCCLARTPTENIVTDPLCAAVPEKACTKLGGKSQGAGSTCFDGTPCSPSGAFLDAGE